MKKDTVFQTTRIYSDSKKNKKLVASLAITATQTAILVSREIGKHPTVGNVRQFTLLIERLEIRNFPDNTDGAGSFR